MQPNLNVLFRTADNNARHFAAEVAPVVEVGGDRASVQAETTAMFEPGPTHTDVVPSSEEPAPTHTDAVPEPAPTQAESVPIIEGLEGRDID